MRKRIVMKNSILLSVIVAVGVFAVSCKSAPQESQSGATTSYIVGEDFNDEEDYPVETSDDGEFVGEEVESAEVTDIVESILYGNASHDAIKKRLSQMAGEEFYEAWNVIKQAGTIGQDQINGWLFFNTASFDGDVEASSYLVYNASLDKIAAAYTTEAGELRYCSEGVFPETEFKDLYNIEISSATRVRK